MFLRMPTVMRITGLGRSTIYRLIADQKFPSPVRLGPRAVRQQYGNEAGPESKKVSRR